MGRVIQFQGHGDTVRFRVMVLEPRPYGHGYQCSVFFVELEPGNPSPVFFPYLNRRLKMGLKLPGRRREFFDIDYLPEKMIRF